MAGPDDALINKIRDTLRELEDTPKNKVAAILDLRLRCRNGKTYTTRFATEIFTHYNGAHTESGEEGVHINNLCINVHVLKYNEPDDNEPDDVGNTNSMIRSTIFANVEPSACFSPRLQSDAREMKNRVTTTDVLQVLKTKLLLMIPECNPTQIELEDGARIQGVPITPYRILRGEDALYSKYGYTNEKLNKLRSLLTTLKMGDLITVPSGYDFFGTHDTDAIIKTLLTILEKEKIPWDNSELVTELMKKLSFEFERTYAANNNIPLSADILESIMMAYFSDNSYSLFQFDPESPGWKEWRQNVVITDYRITLTKNGGGKKRKTRRQRKKRQTRRH